MPTIAKTNRIKIWMVASEGQLRSTGGLADAVHGLSKGLAKNGHAVSVITPAHSGVLALCLRGVAQGYALSHFAGINVPVGSSFETADIFRARVPLAQGSKDRLNIYLVDNRAGTRFGNRAKAYGYADDPERFLFFNRTVLEFYKYLSIADRFKRRRAQFLPDLIHTHDWPTAFVPYFFRHMEGNLPVPLVHSIHNLGYGMEKGLDPNLFHGLTHERNPWVFSSEGLEFYGKIDAAKAAIILADKIVAVSPHYRDEILSGNTPHPADLYAGILQTRQDDVHGLLNGLPDEFNSAGLHEAGILPGDKRECRRKLQHELGLDPDEEAMVLAFTGRWADQKGVDLILESLPQLMQLPVQLVTVGSGDQLYHDHIMALNRAYPGRYQARLFENGMGAKLEALMLAGADASLVPSRYEPCGLVQMKAQRLGCLPIVSRTGGLADTVKDGVTGFVLAEHSQTALMQAIGRALKCFKDAGGDWTAMVSASLALDYSWAKVAQSYVDEIYRPVIQRALLRSV